MNVTVSRPRTRTENISSSIPFGSSPLAQVVHSKEQLLPYFKQPSTVPNRQLNIEVPSEKTIEHPSLNTISNWILKGKIPSTFFDHMEVQNYSDFVQNGDDKYYIAKKEMELCPQVAEFIGSSPKHSNHLSEIIDIGSSGGGENDGGKSAFPKNQFLIKKRPKEQHSLYVPIDVNGAAIQKASKALLSRQEFQSPPLSIISLKAFFNDAFKVLPKIPNQTRLYSFLGATIGNFKRKELRQFLEGLQESSKPGDLLLIGYDLPAGPVRTGNASPLANLAPKTAKTLEEACDSFEQYTPSCIEHLNKSLGLTSSTGGFNPKSWQFNAKYDETKKKIRFSLLCIKPDHVLLPNSGDVKKFNVDDKIYTGISKKFTPDDIISACKPYQFVPVKNWLDEEQYCGIVLLEHKAELLKESKDKTQM
jgi:L-histidine Nalpha-methyltransferase